MQREKFLSVVHSLTAAPKRNLSVSDDFLTILRELSRHGQWKEFSDILKLVLNSGLVPHDHFLSRIPPLLSMEYIVHNKNIPFRVFAGWATKHPTWPEAVKAVACDPNRLAILVETTAAEIRNAAGI